MFGQKPAFGASATPTFSSFSQNAFSKPQGFASASSSSFTPQNTSVFGAQATSGSLFSSTNTQTQQQPAFGTPFGQPLQQQTSLFGSTNATPTNSLFGSNQTSAFGAKSTGFGGFQQQPTTSLFSQPQQQQQTSSLFSQQTPSTGLFGAQPTVPIGQTFGQPATQTMGGTSIAKFQPPNETDTLVKGSSTQYVQTKQQCITFMKEYAEKSLEELRFEDYSANRKGPQTGLFGSNQTVGGMFGGQTTATTGGLFGQNPVQQSSSLFGATATNNNNTLGGNVSSAFATNTNSAFGSGSGLFGKPATPAVTNNAFGFGTNTQSAFGAKPFGQTSSASTGLFTSQPATTGFTGQLGGTTNFGQPATQSLFGTSTNNPASTAGTSFGIANPTSTGQSGFMFGSNNTNTNTSLFGASKPVFSTNAFNTNTQPTTNNAFSGFGAPATSTTGGSLFSGAKPSFGGLMQAPASNNLTFGQSNTGMSGFGSQPAGGSLFGATTNTGTGGGFFNTTSNPFGTTASNSFGAPQISLLNNQQSFAQPKPNEIHQKILAMSSNPYGENELFKGFKSNAFSNETYKSTNPNIQKAFLESNNTLKISPNLASKIKIRPINAVISKKCLFDGLEEHDASLEGNFTIKSNPKRLILNSKKSNQTSSVESEAFNTSSVKDERESFNHQISNEMDQNTDRRVSWLRTIPQKINRDDHRKSTDKENTILHVGGSTTLSKFDSSVANENDIEEVLSDSSALFDNRSGGNETLNDMSLIEKVEFENHPTGIVLRRSGYYTIPSLDELTEFIDENGCCFVSNFTIGRRGYGNVFFDEVIDVSNLNLDEICHFRNKEIILYQDDDKKPPIGEGLNRKAQVTLDNIWPYDKTTHEPIKDVGRLEAMNYEAKLRRICDKRNAKFLEYRPETGSCVFKVDHFSKYSLDDDSDEEMEVVGVHKENLMKNGKDLLHIAKFNQIKQNQANNVNQSNAQKIQFSFIPSNNEAIAEDTPSVDLAKKMRTDPQKLQLMKASFFEHDDKYSALEDTIVDDMDEESLILINDQVVPSSKKLVISDEKIDDFQPAAPKQPTILTQIFKKIGPQSKALIDQPRIFPYDITNIFNSFEESVFNSVYNGKNVAAIPFMMAKKFKVGWTKQNSYTTLTSIKPFSNTGLIDSSNIQASSQCIKIKKFNQFEGEKLNKSFIKHLEIELKYDKKIDVNQSDCKRFEGNCQLFGLLEHYQIAQKVNTKEMDLSVWFLMHVLWKNVNDEFEHQEHSSLIIRRHFVSNWLQNVLTYTNGSIDDKSDYLDQLINLLVCNKITEACELALSKDDLNLSLLIAQTGGSSEIKQLIQDQICCWNEIEASDFIDERKLKILMIIGGIIVAKGPNNSFLSIFEKQNWLRCFALQLWYVSSSISSIPDVLMTYEKNFERDEFICSKPYSHEGYYDMRYHLLQLYSKQNYSLEKLLHPHGYSKNSMDYALSFMVYQVLESLGYHHLNEFSKRKIYKSFAEELENSGHWEWSIWVLMHIHDQCYRESAIGEILYRHIRIADELCEDYDRKERFILENLLIPKNWIYWAKAIRAKTMNNHQLEMKYLLQGDHWNLAHEVLIKHIAPDLIINDHANVLKSHLMHFKETKDIQNWNTQGKILQKFIDMNEKFDRINKSPNIDWNRFLESISQELSELSSTIRYFPCITSKHRLCQSEIAKKMAYIIRKFFANSNLPQSGVILRTAMDKLPLSPENGQQEMKHIMAAFLSEKLKPF